MTPARPVLLVEWYDTTDGGKAHCWAEDPPEFPGIVCESVEQRDEILRDHKAKLAAQEAQ